MIRNDMLNLPFEWDAVQMPLNIMDAHYNSFQKQVLPVANQRDFKPLTEDKINELLDKATLAAKTGETEYYKDSNRGYGSSYHTKVLSEGH